ncbi:hypothetical protein ACFVYD_14155 [Streptomyces sp. NPDC058301]|uniref:hypothetical protein n=1 Tax=Streptomyces sp. NPDC058301 TaxID=3346436 RepID=UPI0036E5EB68
MRSSVAALTRRTVTVPAGATVTVPLRLDRAAHLERSQYGDVTGRLVATADGVSVSTPFSLYVQPETVTLRVKVVDRLGRPASGPSSLDVIGTDDATGERRFNEGAAEQLYTLRPGSYFLSSFVATPDAGEGATLNDSLTYLGRPQLELRKDATVVLDARTAHRLSIATDRPSEARATTLTFSRAWDGYWLHAGTAAGGSSIKGYYASVEGRAHDGTFEFGSYWRAYAPLVSELRTADGTALHPVTAGTRSANLDGTGRARLVDAGSGTPEELKAAGARGAIALVRIPDTSTSVAQAARDAKAAGALAVLAHRASPARWVPAGGFTGPELPVLDVPSGEASALLAKVGAGAVELRWKATAKSPYVYNLAFPRVRRDRLRPHAPGPRQQPRQGRVDLPGDGSRHRLRRQHRRLPPLRRGRLLRHHRPRPRPGHPHRVLLARRHRLGPPHLLQLPVRRGDDRPAPHLPGGRHPPRELVRRGRRPGRPARHRRQGGPGRRAAGQPDRLRRRDVGRRRPLRPARLVRRHRQPGAAPRR